MKEYVKSIDSLRILAILAVVMVHTTTRTLEAAKFNLTGFPVSIFLNQIGRFAVPLFIMISGFVLELNSGEKINYIYYFKRRFSRIALPFIFWSLIYYLFIYTNNHDNFIRVLLTGNASYQLYFIPTLCIFYMAFPFFHKIYKYLAMPLVLLFLGGFQIWLLYIDYFSKEYRFADPIRITFLSFFFFIAGIVAARHKDAINLFIHKWKYILISAAGLSGIYVFWEGFSGYIKTGNYLAYYSTWRPSILIYTFLIGLVLFHLFEKTKLQFSIVEKLSRLSFFVFLIHVIVLEEVWTLFGKSLFNLLSGNIFGNIIFDPIFFGVVASISFLIAFIVHKIPKLYRVTG
jgi:probable poly-beta-1,6-N-acetyl-D-glucosamine export protein